MAYRRVAKGDPKEVEKETDEQLFSRVGIPHEVLTDQGTAFPSKTLKQVYSLLGIKGIRTTPYQPQTDGLVERYNQTLKGMLRKFVAANGKDWDRWLPCSLLTGRSPRPPPASRRLNFSMGDRCGGLWMS